MQAQIEHAHPFSQMDGLNISNGGGRISVGEFVRHWGPYVLTALVVPGGIVIALLLLFRRWNLKRQAVQSAVQA